MKVEGTDIPGVRLIIPDVFQDHRGEYVNLWTFSHAKQDPWLGVVWKEDDISISKKGVIRGFHGDSETFKLIGCLHGRIYVVVLITDMNNSKVGTWMSFHLSSYNRRMLFVPPNTGIAHQVLTSEALFWYKQSREYTGASFQFTYNPLDPKLNIPWPIEDYILSERDQNAPNITNRIPC